MAKDPKTRRQTLSRDSICEPHRRKIKVDPPQLHIPTLQQFRQLDNVHCDPSRLIFAELLAVAVADNAAGVQFLNGPRRRSGGRAESIEQSAICLAPDNLHWIKNSVEQTEAA
jgi:hypothetical protein